jgi:HEAT repeat protein
VDSRDRASILEDLASPHEELRRLAVERLALLPLDDALPRLLDRLGDESWRVRKAAIERLAALPEAGRATVCLIAALGDGENAGRRNAALEALVCCGPAAVPALLEATQTPDVDLRKLVVDALAGIGDPRALGRLEALLYDPDPNVRGAAADALGTLGRPGCAPALLRASVSDPERLVQLSALRALARLHVPVSPEALRPLLADALLRPGVFSALAHSGDREGAITCLVEGLGCGSRIGSEAAMEALLEVASRSTPQQVEGLVARIEAAASAAPAWVESAIARLATAALPARLVLVAFLGLLRRPESVLPLLQAGRDEAVTEVVVAALERFGEVATERLDAAWDDLDADARVLACAVLGRPAVQAGEARLRAGLESADPALRMAAARALGARGTRAALPALVERLDRAAGGGDPSCQREVETLADVIVAVAGSGPDVRRDAVTLVEERLAGSGAPLRRVAAALLGRLGASEDAATLTALLGDTSASVRRAAVESLGHLLPDELPLRLARVLDDESPFVRIAVASALASAPPAPALDALALLAADPDVRVRAAALRAVGLLLRCGAPCAAASRAFAMLANGLRDDEPVALAAAESLRSAGGAEATALARGLLGSAAPELVRAGVACLAQHGDVAALEALVPLIGHAHWSVRAEAVNALASRRVGRRAVPPLLRRLEAEQDEVVRGAILCALERLEG